MKKKVLIIEDDRDLANLFKLILEMSGFEATAVHDGSCGVDVLLNEPLPEAVMLDMHLPGVSGEQIYAMLTEWGEAHRVVICSAADSLRDQARQAGAIDYWLKGSDELFDAVERLDATLRSGK